MGRFKETEYKTNLGTGKDYLGQYTKYEIYTYIHCGCHPETCNHMGLLKKVLRIEKHYKNGFKQEINYDRI